MRYFRFTAFLFAAILLDLVSTVSQQDDTLLCNRVFSFAFEHKLIEKPMGDVIVAVGKQFLGKPYEANTLDRSDSEQLVINLHSFDCVTFVENVLALARNIKSNRLSLDAYTGELRKIRYRGGKIDGYASRLHYFSEWMRDNEKKEILRDITKELGGVLYRKHINFMTTHRASYPKLQNDSAYNLVKQIESDLATHSIFFIPKSKIQTHEFYKEVQHSRREFVILGVWHLYHSIINCLLM
ncbi:MAG: DUF1460 domain-containing protein, partial [Ignavibacteriae bacterium]|nr:DUF1460 domain-containing protein [Ignavibacteriota bacterium]